MSIEPSEYDIDYSEWRCGACNGLLDPDGLCAPCTEECGVWAEKTYVDLYERTDEEMEQYLWFGTPENPIRFQGESW